MPALGARLLVAFDASWVAGGLASWGLGGLRVRRLARASLSPGALVPSPFESNMARPEEIRDALRELREGLGTNGRRAFLILPDGLARIVLLELPPRTPASEYARFRLAQASPYPLSEAIVSTLPVGPGRVLAASVHRRVIEGYETAAAAAGFSQGRLSLAPLAAIVGLRRVLLGGAPTAGVILGTTALSLAVFDGGVLRAFRCRRRDAGPDEAERLGKEVARTASAAVDEGALRVRVVGPGATKLIGELAAAGWSVEPGWRPATGDSAAAVESAWLGAAAG